MKEKKKKGTLVVISGSSGSGKDSVIEGLIKKGLKFTWIITTTTRDKRKGESEGKPYYFTNTEKFEKMIENNELVEWAKVYGNYYGSTFREFEEEQKNNKIVILKPDPFGAVIIKEKFPKSLTIFIGSPSIDILRSRLKKRGTESKEVIEKRLEKAEEEVELSKKFDKIVLNEEDKLNKTVEKVMKIIKDRLR